MASSIDSSKPVAEIPTTASVRTNFAAAASEIGALQDGTTTITDSITAGTTQSQAGATALTTATNRVTVSGTNGDGVKLPTAAAGLEILIINDDAAQTIQVWPNTSDAIDGGSADAVDGNTLAAGASRRYVATDTTNWYTSVSGTGDVSGPGSSTDNAVPRFDSTSGKIIQGSGVIIDNSDNITGVASLTMTGTLGVTGDITVDNLQFNGNTITSTDAAGDINLTPHTTGDIVLDGQKWPQADGANTNVLQTNGSGQLSWAAAGAGDMAAAVYDAAGITEQLVGLATAQTLTNKQLTTIELGHASDTTLARASAGDMNIEGNIAYRAGGTDVPVTDGGTGASTAAGGATALGVGTGDSPQFTGVELGHATDTSLTRASAGVLAVEGVSQAGVSGATAALECIAIAVSDETTALTTGSAKVTFHMPYGFTLTEVQAGVTAAPTGASIIVDINEAGSTILSTLITIDATEKTSQTAATPPVISDTALAAGALIEIDLDQVGSSVAGAGLKAYLIGRQT
jgi:hypothetical protein|tara:strand:- start:4437 stop:5984 length:1548 start_codon:yes stop_codon:yes gene_type:complete